MEVKILSDLLNSACEDSVIPQANGFPVQEHFHHGNTGPEFRAIRCEKLGEPFDSGCEGFYQELEIPITRELRRIWCGKDSRFELRTNRVELRSNRVELRSNGFELCLNSVRELFPDELFSMSTTLYFPFPNETEDHRLQWTIGVCNCANGYDFERKGLPCLSNAKECFRIQITYNNFLFQSEQTKAAKHLWRMFESAPRMYPGLKLYEEEGAKFDQKWNSRTSITFEDVTDYTEQSAEQNKD
eukprot:GHVP01014745.1.p1 GENE.GHVP01014745.1~~GHVP01014745.1.p1  ORF type:complete len:252 (+),score=17.72 GHVP01014745.1:28-756(+)